jgi:hypothetical protein
MIERQKGGCKGRKNDTKPERWVDRLTIRETDKQTDGQIDRGTDKKISK